MTDILLPLYVLSIISSFIASILAVFAIRFSKRTEARLKNNFKQMRSMMDMQHAKIFDFCCVKIRRILTT